MSKITSSLTAKIIATLVIACATLFISKRITEHSFQKIKEPIQHLSENSPQLELVDQLFKDIVQLDNDQRLNADKSASFNYMSFINNSREVLSKLDSLQLLSADNGSQIERIGQMKNILVQRNKLFIQYLNLRNAYRKNDSLTEQINQLSDYINYFSVRDDSSIYSKESNITHTVIENDVPAEETAEAPEKKGLIGKIFGKKTTEPPPKTTKEINHYIYEQTRTNVDTTALKKDDSVINQYSAAIEQIESARKHQLASINSKKAHFEQANSLLIGELLTILNELKATALQKNTANNLLAKNIINNSLQTTNRVLITFIVLTVVFALLIFLDIGRSNRYKKALIQAKEEADALGNIKQKFLANMSHELRTPLQSIIGYSDLMLSDSGQQTEKRLQVVNQSSHHLLNIVNQILDYTSISTGNFKVENRAFNIKNVLQEVYAAILIQAQEKSLEFKTNIDSITDEYIRGDAFRLKQVLFNLLQNAVKFTEQGFVAFDIRQAKGRVATSYTFTISDSGIGIKPDDMERIFNDFEQVSTSQLQNGNGLGLSITKKIIEKHGGLISVESDYGKGSTFIVQMLYPHASVPEHEGLLKEADDITTGTVWFIDDDPYVLELCSRIMSRSNIPHQCFTSYKDLEAIAVPADLRVVFMDIRMPDISGYDLLPIIKSKAAAIAQQVRFIALTAQVLPEETETILQYGFDAVLHKPFREPDLLALLRIEKAAVANDNTANDAEIVQLFKEETTKDLSAIQQSIKQNQAGQIAFCLHKIASRLGQMGYNDLGKEARNMEIAIREGRYNETAVNDICKRVQSLL